jgi:hypothetical protein
MYVCVGGFKGDVMEGVDRFSVDVSSDHCCSSGQVDELTFTFQGVDECSVVGFLWLV